MRSISHVLIISLSLFWADVSVWAQESSQDQLLFELTSWEAAVAERDDERVLLTAHGMERGVELLVGQNAVDFLASLQAKHPSRFDEAGKLLEERGYEATRTVFVARLVRFVPVDTKAEATAQGIRPVAFASTSEGFVITQSWDDGSNATWEGSVYVQRNSDGAWARFEGQFDIATQNWGVIWFEGTDGGGPGGGGPWSADLDLDIGALSRIVPVSAMISPGSLGAGFQPCVYPFAAHPMAQAWFACFLSNASGCAVACRMTGPAWSQCAGACSVGAWIACALQTLLK